MKQSIVDNGLKNPLSKHHSPHLPVFICIPHFPCLMFSRQVDEGLPQSATENSSRPVKQGERRERKEKKREVLLPLSPPPPPPPFSSPSSAPILPSVRHHSSHRGRRSEIVAKKCAGARPVTRHQTLQHTDATRKGVGNGNRARGPWSSVDTGATKGPTQQI